MCELKSPAQEQSIIDACFLYFQKSRYMSPLLEHPSDDAVVARELRAQGGAVAPPAAAEEEPLARLLPGEIVEPRPRSRSHRRDEREEEEPPEIEDADRVPRQSREADRRQPRGPPEAEREPTFNP